MRVRKLTAVLAAVLVLGGLSACTSKAGTAAVVDGHRIGESDVSQYIKVNAQPFKNGSGDSIVPKTLALNTLIAGQLYKKALAENGGAPTRAELSKARDAVLQGGSEAQLTAEIMKSGFTASFEPVYVRTQALSGVLTARVQNGAQKTSKILKSLNGDVSVNASYGKWGKNGLNNDPTGGQPAFLTFNGAAKSAAGAAG